MIDFYWFQTTFSALCVISEFYDWAIYYSLWSNCHSQNLYFVLKLLQRILVILALVLCMFFLFVKSMVKWLSKPIWHFLLRILLKRIGCYFWKYFCDSNYQVYIFVINLKLNHWIYYQGFYIHYSNYFYLVFMFLLAKLDRNIKFLFLFLKYSFVANCSSPILLFP